MKAKWSVGFVKRKVFHQPSGYCAVNSRRRKVSSSVQSHNLRYNAHEYICSILLTSTRLQMNRKWKPKNGMKTITIEQRKIKRENNIQLLSIFCLMERHFCACSPFERNRQKWNNNSKNNDMCVFYSRCPRTVGSDRIEADEWTDTTKVAAVKVKFKLNKAFMNDHWVLEQKERGKPVVCKTKAHLMFEKW